MRRAAILINPTSGKGRSAHNAPLALDRLRAHGVAVTTLLAGSAEAGLDLARRAVADGVDALVACGGDGTVHLALQAVYGTDTLLGIVPVGTGDDIARSLRIPRDDPRAAADVIAAGHTRRVDHAVVRAADGAERAFLAVMSAGFDSQVNARANAMKWPTGKSRYLLATLAELGVYRAADFTITVDGQSLHEPGMLLAIGNGPSYGGGMHICPGASLDDGLLDLTFLTRTSKATFLKVFPRVYKGTHVDSPVVRTLRGTRIRVEAPGQTAFADGEYVGPLPVDVQVVPQGLRVLVPAGQP